MMDNYYAKLFHETEDYWMPKGFESVLAKSGYSFEWKNIRQWKDLEHGSRIFQEFIKALTFENAFGRILANRASMLIEAQLLVVDEKSSRYRGWQDMMMGGALDNALEIWRDAANSPARDFLKAHLLTYPGWVDRKNLEPSQTTYEQVGYVSMAAFEIRNRIVSYIHARHREIPRYIGGAMRLGGLERAEKEFHDLFEALEDRPHNRANVIEILGSSRFDKKLFLQFLKPKERGQVLVESLGL